MKNVGVVVNNGVRFQVRRQTIMHRDLFGANVFTREGLSGKVERQVYAQVVDRVTEPIRDQIRRRVSAQMWEDFES